MTRSISHPRRSLVAAGPVCFETGRAHSLTPLDLGPLPRPAQATALAALLPTLLCGEESAYLVFERFAARAGTHACRSALARIAAEEAQHETLLRRLRGALDAAGHSVPATPGVQQFFRAAGDRDPGRHFMRIAALDSALCTLLAELRRGGGIFVENGTIDAIFARIHRDEARHVATSLGFARLTCGRAERLATADEMRGRFARMLMGQADALETLGTDPDRLFAQLSTVPSSLGR
jgi:hypothetical protein